MVSSKLIAADCPFHEPLLIELPLPVKMVFLRRYMAATLLQLTLVSSVCTLIILSPMARFYINENVWLLFLLLFLCCSTYLSLVHFTKLSVAKLTLMIHVAVEAMTVGVLVTYNDLIVVYQAVLVATICFFWLFLYTLQSKWDYGICITIAVYCICSLCFSYVLQAVFGGTPEENFYWMGGSCFILDFSVFELISFFMSSPLDPSDFNWQISIFERPTIEKFIDNCNMEPVKHSPVGHHRSKSRSHLHYEKWNGVPAEKDTGV